MWGKKLCGICNMLREDITGTDRYCPAAADIPTIGRITKDTRGGKENVQLGVMKTNKKGCIRDRDYPASEERQRIRRTKKFNPIEIVQPFSKTFLKIKIAQKSTPATNFTELETFCKFLRKKALFSPIGVVMGF